MPILAGMNLFLGNLFTPIFFPVYIAGTQEDTNMMSAFSPRGRKFEHARTSMAEQNYKNTQ